VVAVIAFFALTGDSAPDSSPRSPLNRVGLVPVAQSATSSQAPAPVLVTSRRQRAEPVIRRLLVVSPPPATGAGRAEGEASAHRLFNLSMALSGLRCLIGYVVLPIVTPALGAAARVGPMIGVPIAVVALAFDVMAVRRFWAADHRWRWGISLIYVVVMSLVLALLVGDIVHLAS
jgi:hypothetical protein